MNPNLSQHAWIHPSSTIHPSGKSYGQQADQLPRSEKVVEFHEFRMQLFHCNTNYVSQCGDSKARENNEQTKLPNSFLGFVFFCDFFYRLYDGESQSFTTIWVHIFGAFFPASNMQIQVWCFCSFCILNEQLSREIKTA